MRYGLPYQGSKNKLAERIVQSIPPAKHFYDVFAGGCAVTHAALLSRKYGCVHFSDINDSVVLFRDYMEGNLPDGSEWISREEFERRKDSDPYVRILWSFGNNQKNYLYGPDIEPYKKAVHEMIYAQTPTERRMKFRKVCEFIPKIIWGGLDSMYSKTWNIKNGETIPNSAFGAASATLSETERLATHGSIELNRLQHDERRHQLSNPFCHGEYEMQVCDYKSIKILPDSVIYADIPYKGTGGYGEGNFNYDEFYDWCEAQTEQIFISEYWMPEDRFKAIKEWNRTSTFSKVNNNLKKVEKLFVPIKNFERYKKKEQLTLFDI